MGKPGDPGRSGRDNRLFVDAVLWQAPAGMTCRRATGRCTSVSPAGPGGRVGMGVRYPDTGSRQCLSHARQHHHARASTGGHRKRGDRNQALGRSRGGLTTKVRIACDTLGRPLRAILSPGQAGGAPQALALMEGFRPRLCWPTPLTTPTPSATASPTSGPGPSSPATPGESIPSATTPKSANTETASNASSTSSSTSGASQRDTTEEPCTSSPSSISPLL